MQFFEFSNAYNFETKHRGELGNPSFCSEFFALSDDCIHKYFCQTFENLIFQWNGFLENSLHQISFEILAHTVFDREFQGLSKSLFRFDLAVRLC
jgi:hypothetical protein